MSAVISIKYDRPGNPQRVELPLSKSVALRVMTLNAMAECLGKRPAAIPNLPDAEDVKGMLRAMRALQKQGHESGIRVNIGEGGAPFRFFTALAASIPGVDITLLTKPALIRRPHAMLLDSLRNAGADIRSLRRPGRPPLRICGKRLGPDELTMNPGVSSQYISALMMASPLWKNGLQLHFEGETPVSLPYLRMTAAIMERFGCMLQMQPERIDVAPDVCTPPEEYEIPTDWSAASYFYEIALLLPATEIPVRRLTPPEDSLQGDSVCIDIFGRLGVETRFRSDGSAILCYSPEKNSLNKKIEDDSAFTYENATCILDLNGTPDLAPALCVAFCLAGIRFRFENVAHLRHKETDRMSALATELKKLGYLLWTASDSMGWDGENCEPEAQPTISTYSDHRMAMAFAPAAVRFSGLRIEHPEVVGKSFPRYWDALRNLGFHISP